MKYLKKIMVIVISLAILVGGIPLSSLPVFAGAGLESGGIVNAGQTATITTYGTGLMLTNLLFESEDSFSVVLITKYDSSGNILEKKEISGKCSYEQYNISNGIKYTLDVYGGAVEIIYNYANTIPPKIEIEANNKKINYLFETNISNIFLTVGETAEYKISEVFPGYYAGVYSDKIVVNDLYFDGGYKSMDNNVVKVNSDGTLTAVGVGETKVYLLGKFGFSESNSFFVLKKCTVTVLDDYGIQDAYKNYYAEGNDKYFNIIIPDDGEERTTGFNIKVGDKVYNTGDDYQTMITFPDAYKGDVIVSKEGFISYTLKNEYISAYNWVTLYPDDYEAPVIQSVLGHQIADSEWYNLKVRSLYVYEDSNELYQINVNIDSGDKVVLDVWLQQGDVTIPVDNGTTGEVALGQFFTNCGEPVYVYVRTSGGIIVKSQVLINVYSPDKYAYLDFGDEGGLEASVEANVDALKEMPFSLKLSGNIPFEYTIDEDGKVRGTLGITITPYKNKYTYYDDIKETIQTFKFLGDKPTSKAKSKEVQKLVDRIGEDDGIIATAHTSFGISCDTVFLGYVEGYMVNGKLDVSEIGMVCSVSGDVTFSQQSMAFAVPHYWEVKIATELEVPLLVVGKNKTGNFQVRIPEMQFKISFSGKLAAGLQKVAGIGVELSADLTIEIPGDDKELKDCVWTISVTFQPYKQILGMEYTDVYWNPLLNWQVYPYQNPDNALMSMVSDQANYTQMARSYLLKRATFGSGIIEVDNEHNLTVETIATDTYTDTKPQALCVDGKTLLVWVGDEKNRIDENRTCLYYSVYDETNETWSEPVAILNDGKADFNPVLKKVDGKVYLLWQKASEEYAEGATLSDIASKLDIYFAEFDAETGTFSVPANISTENHVYDANPTITSVGGNVTVVWSQNSDSNVFGAAGTNSILAATNSNGKWDKIVLAEGLKTISGLTATEKDGMLAVYFGADTDEEYATSDDIEIFSIQNGNILQVTDNDSIDAMPQIASGTLYWYNDGHLTDGTQDIPSSTDATYTIVNSEDGKMQAILYTVSANLTNNVYAVFNDGNGWGTPMQITSFTDSKISDFSGYFENGDLVIVANCRTVLADGGLGEATLKKVTKTLTEDLSLDEVTYDDYSLISGEMLRGNATVTNNGTSTAKSFSITVSNQNGNVLAKNDISTMVLPGETVEADFYCNVDTITDNEIVLTVSSSDIEDSNTANDALKMEIDSYDISVENAFAEIDSNGETTITAFVVNRGLSPLSDVELTFFKDDIDGAVLGTTTVDTVDVGSSVLVSFKTTEVQPDSVVYVCANELDKENIYTNNCDFAYTHSTLAVTNNIFVEQDSIVEGNLKQNNAYIFEVGDTPKTYTGDFKPEKTGFYKLEFGKNDSYLNYSVSILDSSGTPVLRKNKELSNFGLKYRITRELYYFEANQVYNFTIEINENQSVDFMLDFVPFSQSFWIKNQILEFNEGDNSDKIDVEFPANTYGVLKYSSSDELVASVDSEGVVTPHLPGTATVTVMLDGTNQYITCTITVNEVKKTVIQEDLKYTNLTNGVYVFKPDKTGCYLMQFSGNSVQLYDDEWNKIAESKKTMFYFEAGQSYYLNVRYASSNNSGIIEYICQMEENNKETIEITEAGKVRYYTFTPDEYGFYAFYSSSNVLIYGEILDVDMNYLDGAYLGGEDRKLLYEMEEGKTYVLAFSYSPYSDDVGSFDVYVQKERHITSIEVVSLPVKMDYIKDLVFQTLDYDGLELKVTWSDGTTTDWKYNVDGSYIEDEYVYISDYSANDTGVIYITCGWKETSFTINLMENPVENIEVISRSAHSYIENYDGYWNEWYNEETGEYEEYFYYYSSYPYDAVIQINYKDGTSKIADVGDYIDGYEIEWYHNQYDKPWIVGGNNQSTISYLGTTVNLPITVIENPVESIELVSGTSHTYIENIDGWWNEWYNEETEQYEEYFHYYTNYPYDAVVKINYKDGTSETANVGDYIDGYEIEWYHNQYDKPWIVGGNNQSTISYLGTTVNLPITVIENPVDRIEINTAPTREYVYGDITRYAANTLYGELSASGTYWFYPEDLTGLSFTVYYKDGTSKTYTHNDIDDDYYIDGYEVELSYDEFNPEPGNFPVTFSYMGCAADYTVVLKESPVASIEVVKGPDKSIYLDYYEPLFEGMEFKITYTDGTSKIVTVTEENMIYDYDWYFDFYAKMYIDGYLLQIEEYWLGEGTCYFAKYLGQSCKVEDIIYTDGKEIASVELDNVTWNGEGMVVNVTYEDGTTETITLNDLILRSGRENEYFEGMGKTENGYLYVYIETYLDENDEVESYYVDILGEDIEVEPSKPDVLIGDVNSDGVIDARDITFLRRYYVGWDVTIDEVAADVNVDGVIDARDITILRRYYVGWDIELG